MMDEGENGKARTDPSKLLCRWASYDAHDELATPPAVQLAEQRVLPRCSRSSSATGARSAPADIALGEAFSRKTTCTNESLYLLLNMHLPVKESRIMWSLHFRSKLSDAFPIEHVDESIHM